MEQQPQKLDYRSPPERKPVNEQMSENLQLLVGFTLGVVVSFLFSSFARRSSFPISTPYMVEGGKLVLFFICVWVKELRQFGAGLLVSMWVGGLLALCLS